MPDGRAWDGDRRGRRARRRSIEPLERLDGRVRDGEGHGFDLEVRRSRRPAELGDGVGGMEGYEQLCRVEGDVRTGRRPCASPASASAGTRGARRTGSGWTLARTVGVWLDDDAAVIALHGVRPAGASGHDDEAVGRAYLFEGERACAVADPRLSTTYDGEGRQRRAGLELWVGEEDALPAAPRARSSAARRSTSGACGWTARSSRWRMEGRAGVGRYDVLRRA